MCCGHHNVLSMGLIDNVAKMVVTLLLDINTCNRQFVECRGCIVFDHVTNKVVNTKVTMKLLTCF